MNQPRVVVLLVGGPFDGERRSVESGTEFLVVPILPPNCTADAVFGKDLEKREHVVHAVYKRVKRYRGSQRLPDQYNYVENPNR